MQTRREFISSATVTLLMIPIVAACSSGSSSGGAVEGATDPGCGSTGIGSTGTVANNHTHTICVADSDLTSPPAGGATYVTSNVLDHTHSVVFTQAQLMSIGAGQSVTVTSSAPNPTHDFMVMKA